MFSGFKSRLTEFLGSQKFGSVLVLLILFLSWMRNPSPVIGLVAFMLFVPSLPTRESRQVGFLISGSAALVGLISFLILHPERIAWADKGLSTYFWVILLSFWMVLSSSLSEGWRRRLSWLLILLIVMEITLTLSYGLIVPVTRGGVRDPLVGAILLSMAGGALISLYAGAYAFLRLWGVVSGALLGGVSLAIAGIARLSLSPPDVWSITRQPLLFVDFPFALSLIVSAGLLPAMLLHLLLLIPDPLKWLERRRLIYHLIYLPPLWMTVGLLNRFYLGYPFRVEPIGFYILCLYMFAGLIVTARGYAVARQRGIRREMLFILISLLFTFLLI
ncbi:TPA: hypothetical protein EYP37_09475, partial [Candidatus Poribacteria bacterium]|nr:hypothetical protein [Candidatus Poribacteria bacterium]